MDRDFFNFITKDFLEDGVKKACYIVREYKRYEKLGDFTFCAVTKEEYEKALNIILAYSFQTSNNYTLAEQWQCDSDCNKNNGLFGFCPGEFQLSEDPNKRLCKYFSNPFDK